MITLHSGVVGPTAGGAPVTKRIWVHTYRNFTAWNYPMPELHTEFYRTMGKFCDDRMWILPADIAGMRDACYVARAVDDLMYEPAVLMAGGTVAEQTRAAEKFRNLMDYAEDGVAWSVVGSMTQLKHWLETSGKKFRNPYVTIIYPDGSPAMMWRVKTNSFCLGRPVTEETIPAHMLDLLKFAMELKTKEGEKPKADIPPPIAPVMGLDIEFSAIDADGLFHPATEFVPDTQDGEIGTDGNVETIELRPQAGSTPQEVVDNLAQLLENLVPFMPPGHDLFDGGGGYFRRSTGIHLHYSGFCTDFDRSHTYQQMNEVGQVAVWFDKLLLEPVLAFCTHTERGERNYGRPSDIRCKANKNGFSHVGFEYRSLPTICADRKALEAILHIGHAIVTTYHCRKSISFDETKFSTDWYKDLIFADQYAHHIRYFVDWLEKKPKLGAPVLYRWFDKEFAKDRECDVAVRFANDVDGYLAISNFTMYNPQKKYSQVVIYARKTGAGCALSPDDTAVSRFLVGKMGWRYVHKAPSAAMKVKYDDGRTLFVGIPAEMLAKLSGGNIGSRNRIKMFAQSLVKEI